MTEKRHDRVGAIFSKARRLSAGERTAFLGTACADDAALREEVESLLAEHKEASGFLDTGALREKLGEIAAESISGDTVTMPDRIGAFRILRIIGEGGMGVVYEAQQDDPKRRVALKVIRGGMATPALLVRFRHEAQVLGQLHHPGIAHIYQAGTADEGAGGRPFFAMELVRGRPLLEHAHEHGLDTRQRLELVARICDALHHAHQKGIVHRDLKPANVLVEGGARGEVGQPKVLDFGVARVTNADIQTVTLQTNVGQLVGTLPYMSPEQAGGNPATIDIRSDVYSVGVIAYELLGGRLPYAVEGKMIHEAVRVIREDDPARLSSIDRALRGDVETILAKALAKEKDRRYQSAAELAADIRRYLNNEPITARPTSALYQFRKFARRNRAVVGGVTAVTVVAFVALVGATVYSLGQARLARSQTYQANIAAAESALEAGDPAAARQRLDAAQSELRNWEWRYLDARLDQAIALVEPDEPIAAAALGAEGLELITLSTSGALRVHDLFGGSSRVDADLDLDGPVAAAAFSRNAGLLAAVHGPEGRIASMWRIVRGAAAARLARWTLPASGTDIAISSGGERLVVAMRSEFMAWDPRVPDREPTRWHVSEGQRVFDVDEVGDTTAIAGGFPGLQVHDIATGEQRWAIRHGSEFFSVAISPDGRLVATGGVDKRIRIRETATGTHVHDLSGHRGFPRALAFSPDGRRLVSGGDDLTLRVWDIASGLPEQVLTGHRSLIRAVRFSADGTRLHSEADDGIRVWSVEPDDHTAVLRVHTNDVRCVAFSPDGATLYSVDGDWVDTIRAWDASSGALLEEVDSPRAQFVSLAVSPDGRMLAVGDRGGELVLWDAALLEPVRTMVGHNGTVVAVSFSPDGRRLVSCSDQDQVFIWDAATGERLRERSGSGKSEIGVAFAPDGLHVAVTTSEGVGIDDIVSGKRIRTLAVPAVVHAVAWSLDGNWIAVGSGDHAVGIFDAATGSLRHERQGHAAAVNALVFSPDGTRLASGSNDTTIRIWDVETGEPVGRLRGHHDFVADLAFSPDGRMLASASGDSTVRVWDTAPARARWQAAARARARHRRPVPALDLAGDPFDGFCLEFDGAVSHVLVGASDAFRFEESFTVEAWIRPLTDVPSGTRAIVNKEGEYQLSLGHDGRLQYTVANLSGEGWRSWKRQDLAPPADVWTHVALVYAPDGVRTYVNGRLAGTNGPPGAIADYHPDHNELRIARRQWGDPGFRGMIDEVRIWSVARERTEIRDHMLEALRGDETGLVGYWRFDEGAGEKAGDETGRHDASVIDAIWRPTRTHPDPERQEPLSE